MRPSETTLYVSSFLPCRVSLALVNIVHYHQWTIEDSDGSSVEVFVVNAYGLVNSAATVSVSNYSLTMVSSRDSPPKCTTWPTTMVNITIALNNFVLVISLLMINRAWKRGIPSQWPRYHHLDCRNW